MSNESKAVRLIAAERRRQIEQEGWSANHDDEHDAGELVDAAACYLLNGGRKRPPARWPWDTEWWKPGTDPVRRLVKAGALIAAEIDRLTREKKRDAEFEGIRFDVPKKES